MAFLFSSFSSGSKVHSHDFITISSRRILYCSSISNGLLPALASSSLDQYVERRQFQSFKSQTCCSLQRFHKVIRAFDPENEELIFVIHVVPGGFSHLRDLRLSTWIAWILETICRSNNSAKKHAFEKQNPCFKFSAS